MDLTKKENRKMPELSNPRPAMVWISEAQAAEILGWTVGTLKQYRRNGKGPIFTRGGHIQYDAADVHNYLNNRKENPEA